MEALRENQFQDEEMRAEFERMVFFLDNTQELGEATQQIPRVDLSGIDTDVMPVVSTKAAESAQSSDTEQALAPVVELKQRGKHSKDVDDEPTEVIELGFGRDGNYGVANAPKKSKGNHRATGNQPEFRFNPQTGEFAMVAPETRRSKLSAKIGAVAAAAAVTVLASLGAAQHPKHENTNEQAAPVDTQFSNTALTNSLSPLKFSKLAKKNQLGQQVEAMQSSAKTSDIDNVLTGKLALRTGSIMELPSALDAAPAPEAAPAPVVLPETPAPELKTPEAAPKAAVAATNPNTAPAATPRTAPSPEQVKTPIANPRPTSLKRILQLAGFTGNDLKIAYGVALAESGGNSHAHNPNAKTGDNSYGLFQINMLGSMGPARRKMFGLKSNDDLFDPVVNARVARQMSRGGWSPWSTFKHGDYKRHYNDAGDVQVK